MSEVLIGAAVLAIAVAVGYAVRYGRARPTADRSGPAVADTEGPQVVEADASCLTGDNLSVTTRFHLTFERSAAAAAAPDPSRFMELMTVTALRDAVGGRDAVDLDAEHRAVTDHTEQVLHAAASERGLVLTTLRIDRFVPAAPDP